MDALHCNTMHRCTLIDLSCIVMYQTQLIAKSSKNLLSSEIRLNTVKTPRNFTSTCLYIPWLVPNTCGFSMTSLNRFIELWIHLPRQSLHLERQVEGKILVTTSTGCPSTIWPFHMQIRGGIEAISIGFINVLPCMSIAASSLYCLWATNVQVLTWNLVMNAEIIKRHISHNRVICPA